mmetsp:Transcript_8289/g.16623  ORF Transcript_8289/g.16623 Transcript_8289/m.16623 type:complete len:202 (+) Transcript_8289:73-678(+)
MFLYFYSCYQNHLLGCTQPSREDIVILSNVVRICHHLAVEFLGNLLHSITVSSSSLKLGFSGLLCSRLFRSQQVCPALGLGSWVQLQKGTEISQWVLLQWGLASSLLWTCYYALNLVTVNQTGQIRVGHDVAWDFVSLLHRRLCLTGAEDFVQPSKCTLGPDNESTQMTSWGELEQVEAVHIGHLHSWDVAEGASNLWRPS